MRTKIFWLLLLFVSIATQAQDLIQFKLQRNGLFATEDGKSYIVVEYEGKTAQELYSMVKSNVIKLYKSPKDVMSENEPNSISIFALSDIFDYAYIFGGGLMSYSAYYNLVFHFKDGKIKVDAPMISPNLNVSSTGSILPRTFSSLIGRWYDKKGNLKKKRIENVQKVERLFNYPINYLLQENNVLEYNNDELTEEDW